MLEAKPTLSPAQEFDRSESTVLLLLTAGDNDRPWSVEEVIRELGDRNKAIDAIANLHGAGLIHRSEDNFVWPTRAAVRGIELAEWVPTAAPRRLGQEEEKAPVFDRQRASQSNG